MKEIPEATKAYNKRHSLEVKAALDVLRQYVIGLDNIEEHPAYPCDYCIMKDVCFKLFSKCCPAVFEYHRSTTTDEIVCGMPDMYFDVRNIKQPMTEDEMISMWRKILKKHVFDSMGGDDRDIYPMLKHLSKRFLIRTRKYSNNEAALDEFYDEYEQEAEDEMNGVGRRE